MYLSAGEISKLVNGTLAGDPEVKVYGPSKIEDGKEGSVSFIANQKYLDHAYQSTASVLILGKDVNLDQKIKPAIIRVEDPYSSFAKILEKFNSFNTSQTGIEQPSFISESAELGTGVYIGAFTYIGTGVKIGNNVKIFPNCHIGKDVEIGDNTIIYAGVNIYHQTRIGRNCIVHSGAVIGSDGFGFAPQANGTYYKIPQLGNVIIEDHVEVGANTTIDRATMGSTIIRNGVKLDNLIQIAHNTEIGENSVIAAQAGISGSTKIGERCVIGGQAGFVGHINIAPDTKVNAQSGVAKSVKNPGTALTGSPALEYYESLRAQVIYKKLPALEKKVLELEKNISGINS